MCSREKPSSKIWLQVIAVFLNFAVSIIMPPAFFSLCSVNTFNCGTLTEFLQLLPIPNTVLDLCIYITQAEWLEGSFLLPLEMSHWCRIHEAPANQMSLCTGKSFAAFTGVSFHVHFQVLLFFSCPKKWPNIREGAWLGPGHSHHKQTKVPQRGISQWESHLALDLFFFTGQICWPLRNGTCGLWVCRSMLLEKKNLYLQIMSSICTYKYYKYSLIACSLVYAC